MQIVRSVDLGCHLTLGPDGFHYGGVIVYTVSDHVLNIPALQFGYGKTHTLGSNFVSEHHVSVAIGDEDGVAVVFS